MGAEEADAEAERAAPEAAGIAAAEEASFSEAQAEQLYTLLPLMGFSDACQLGVIDAGVTCLGDFQAEISEVSGIDFASLASAGAPTLTEDQISQLVDALVPVAQKELPTKDADGNGMISAQCCTKMA